jgi:hypothetical protein
MPAEIFRHLQGVYVSGRQLKITKDTGKTKVFAGPGAKNAGQEIRAPRRRKIVPGKTTRSQEKKTGGKKIEKSDKSRKKKSYFGK